MAVKESPQNHEETELTGYELMDQADEKQIVTELEGRYNPNEAEKELVYSFKDKYGHEIVGLSWWGTKAVQWKLNKDKTTDMTVTDKVNITQGDGYVDVAVYAFDKKRNIGMWGMARGYTEMRLRNNKVITDPFASAKAMSKAQRNALNNLFPSDLVAKLIKEWQKKGNVKKLKARKSTGPDLTPEEKGNIQPWLNKVKMVKTKKEFDKILSAMQKANLTGKEIYHVRKFYNEIKK